MTVIQTILTVALITAGLLLMLAGSLGILRLPDFYCRTHAASKVDTLGIILVLGGLAVWEGWTLNAAKLVAGIAFIMLANPVAVHALARAALRLGVKPWFADAPKQSGNKTDERE